MNRSYVWLVAILLIQTLFLNTASAASKTEAKPKSTVSTAEVPAKEDSPKKSPEGPPSENKKPDKWCQFSPS